MIGRLDLDGNEEKKCYDSNYGKKYKSYRMGYQAGKRDGRKLEEAMREKNPYLLSPEIWALLRKRARWEAGYQLGWQIGGQKKKEKLKKRRRIG